MKIEPYIKVGEIKLGVCEAELLHILGEPKRKKTNGIGLLEFHFGSQIYRFEASGALSEVTIESEAVQINNVSIPFAHLAPFVRANDAEVFERVGFVVSPAFGLAFDPECRPWVTVLTKSSLEAWRSV